MSSYYYGGSIRMNPEVETEDRILSDHYPYQLPKVYIEGKGKRNHKWTQYDWGDDSVVEIRDKHIARYTRTAFAEMLVENKRGESVWVNSKMLYLFHGLMRRILKIFVVHSSIKLKNTI
jgi:hypothetical protein